jgi:hypothetical protein
MQFLEEHATPNAQSAKGKKSYSKQTAAMIAIRGRKIVYATMDEVKAKADMKLRKGKDEWWRSIKPLAEVSHTLVGWTLRTDRADVLGYGWTFWFGRFRTRQGEGRAKVDTCLCRIYLEIAGQISNQGNSKRSRSQTMHRWCIQLKLTIPTPDPNSQTPNSTSDPSFQRKA